MDFFLLVKFWTCPFFYYSVFMYSNFPYAHTFLCSRSKASWSPTAFISVFWRAEVMYMCISRNRSMAPPCSACSISNCDKRFTNHSNDRWSRLIQKKSTYFWKIEKELKTIFWLRMPLSWTQNIIKLHGYTVPNDHSGTVTEFPMKMRSLWQGKVHS